MRSVRWPFPFSFFSLPTFFGPVRCPSLSFFLCKFFFSLQLTRVLPSLHVSGRVLVRSLFLPFWCLLTLFHPSGFGPTPRADRVHFRARRPHVGKSPWVAPFFFLPQGHVFFFCAKLWFRPSFSFTFFLLARWFAPPLRSDRSLFLRPLQEPSPVLGRAHRPSARPHPMFFLSFYNPRSPRLTSPLFFSVFSCRIWFSVSFFFSISLRFFICDLVPSPPVRFRRVFFCFSSVCVAMDQKRGFACFVRFLIRGQPPW